MTGPADVVVSRTADPAFPRVGRPAADTDEHYRLTVSAGPRFELTCSSDRGELLGRAHVADLVRTGRLAAATYDEHPAFPVRGVIEGFYGTPWTHAQRRDMIRFLAARRMNTFVYSPKDDAHTRRHWREPYPPDQLDELATTVSVATEVGITVSYGVSPGLSVRYSDATEADRVLARFDEVAAVGVRDLALLLDDIPDRLLHEQDRAAYPDLVSAQVGLIERVRRRLDERDPRIGLTVCPTHYHGRGDEAYLRALGRVDPRIDLFWTGRAVCSPELDLTDAATFARTTSRPVLYWDNYPVNDVAMTAELHLGAYRGRDPHLFRFSRGIVANPMEHAEASKIALATIADYLWDPVGYDPDASWRDAAVAVAGAADADALLCFADNVRTSCLEQADALVLTDALERLEFEQEYGDPEAGRAGLRAVAARFVAAAEQLLGPDVANPVLATELRPWLLRFQDGALSLLAQLDGTSSLATEYGDPRRPQVFGDVLDMFVRARPARIDTAGTHPQTDRK